MTELLPKNLETPAFPDYTSKNVLREWLDTMNHIQPEFVSREDFNKLKGNFLFPNGKIDHIGNWYTLKLPEDIKVRELPAIMRRVNHLTFGSDNPPDYRGGDKLKVSIVYAIDSFLGNFSDTPSKDEKETIKKYVQFFQELYGENEANQLSNKKYRQEIISKKFSQIQISDQKKISIKTQEELDSFLASVVDKNFRETFFQRGTYLLATEMKTMTREDGQRIENRKNKNITGENIELRVSVGQLDGEEKKLRDSIQIDKWKEVLSEVRKNKDRVELSKLEYEVVNIIIKELYKYAYQFTIEHKGYQPSGILTNKEIQCVGFSLLGHTFLQELGIKHQGLNIPLHSALLVELANGESYFFDATFGDYIPRFKFGGQVGSYYKFQLYDRRKNQHFYINGDGGIAFSGEVTSILQSKIYNNKGVALGKFGKYAEAIAMYDKSIELNPQSSSAYNNKGSALGNLGKKNISKLYFFSHLILRGQDSWFDIWFRVEKQNIREKVKNGDYNGLRIYLLELEEILDQKKKK